MSHSLLERVEHRLVNEPGGDPGLYIDLIGLRRAVIFDLGESSLSTRDLIKAADVCISHTHIDHWIGFDRLLRSWIGRARELRIHGPEGMAEHVWHRIHGYVWNLTFEDHLRIVTHEVVGDEVRVEELSIEDRFQRRRDHGARPHDGVLIQGPGFRVEFAEMDHSTTCLGFALVEDARYSFDPERLKAAGEAPGPGLRELRARFLAGEEPERAASLGEFTPERRYAYVTDTAFSAKSVAAVKRIAGGADVLYCEATYPEAEADKAAEVRHLSAGQCGAMARAAGAQSLVPFHFSRKHAADPSEILADVEAGRDGRPDWLGRIKAAEQQGQEE
jgi:ribonuclease Z